MKGIIFLLIPVALVVAAVIIHNEPSETYCKKFVISHADEWVKEGEIYKINHTERKYYTDVTIKPLGTDSYYLIFWGNRDSWLWAFRLDKAMSVDVPYREYKNKNVTLDKQIVEILNKKAI